MTYFSPLLYLNRKLVDCRYYIQDIPVLVLPLMVDLQSKLLDLHLFYNLFYNISTATLFPHFKYTVFS